MPSDHLEDVFAHLGASADVNRSAHLIQQSADHVFFVVQYILHVDLLLRIFAGKGFEDCGVDAFGVEVEDFFCVDVVFFSFPAAEEEDGFAESGRQVVFEGVGTFEREGSERRVACSSGDQDALVRGILLRCSGCSAD